MLRKSLIMIGLLSMMITVLISGPFIVDEANASFTVDPGTHIQETDNSSFSDIFESLLNSTLGLIPKTIEIIISIMLAPLRALGTIFDSWGLSVAGSGVFAPVIGVFVIILIFVLIRIYSAFDNAGDKVQDMMSPGNE